MESVDLGLRYSLKKNLLKSVLIRVDFTGVSGLERWVDENRDFMFTTFGDYSKGYNNNARLDLNNLEDVAKTLSIPVSEVTKETQHIYTLCKLGTEDEVKMTLTSYFMTFYVLCKNYKNIDVYLDFINRFFEQFVKISEYMKVRRIGIRKISGKPFESIDQAYQVFKPELFFGNSLFDGFRITQREYKDYYILPDNSMRVNYTRMFREQNTPNGVRYAFVLDTDCYVDEYLIKENNYDLPAKIGEIMTQINNHLFELFYNSVQKSYIEHQGDEQ